MNLHNSSSATGVKTPNEFLRFCWLPDHPYPVIFSLANDKYDEMVLIAKVEYEVDGTPFNKSSIFLFLSSKATSMSLMNPSRSSLPHSLLWLVTFNKNFSNPCLLSLMCSDSSPYHLSKALFGGIGGIMHAGYLH